MRRKATSEFTATNTNGSVLFSGASRACCYTTLRRYLRRLGVNLDTTSKVTRWRLVPVRSGGVAFEPDKDHIMLFIRVGTECEGYYIERFPHAVFEAMKQGGQWGLKEVK